jgi:hypothetical protein
VAQTQSLWRNTYNPPFSPCPLSFLIPSAVVERLHAVHVWFGTLPLPPGNEAEGRAGLSVASLAQRWQILCKSEKGRRTSKDGCSGLLRRHGPSLTCVSSPGDFGSAMN